jgi:hypothetical protein
LTVWRVLMLKAIFPLSICVWDWRFEILVRKTYWFRVNLPVHQNPRSAQSIFAAFDHAFWKNSTKFKLVMFLSPWHTVTITLQ